MEKDTPSRQKGVLLDLGSLDKHDLDLTPILTTLPRWETFEYTPPERVHERLAQAQVAVVNKVILDQNLLETLPQLRLICVAATGTDNVDLVAAEALGITVCNVRDYATDSVVQHWLTLLLALVRRLEEHHRAATEGIWSKGRHFTLLDYPLAELGSLHLGIVGYGTLGQAVARMAKALGMRVSVAERPGTAPRPGRVAWEKLVQQVDVLSLHCPLTDQTRGLVDHEVLYNMRPGALLINTARGGLVDSMALAEALRAGQIGGAALDVLDQEPPPPDHPLLARDLPRLIITPHVAWAAREARQRLVNQIAETIRAFLAGQPRNRVNAPASPGTGRNR